MNKRIKERYYQQILTEIKLDLEDGRIKRNKYGKFKKSKVLGYIDGKKMRADIYGETPEDVARQITDKYEQFITGEYEYNNILFNDVAKEWFENNVKKSKRSSGNIKNYQSTLSKHIYPYFKGAVMKNLRVKHFQEFLNSLDEFGESNIKKIRMTVCAIVRYAVDNEYTKIPSNFRLVLPDYKPMNKRDRLTDNEFNMIVRVLKEHKSGYATAILLFCGLRAGEALNLKWQDIDFEKKYLRVTRSKTANGENRVVPIPDFCLGLLKKQKKKCDKIGKKNEYVLRCPTDFERTMSYESLAGSFKNVLRTADIKAGAVVKRNQIVESKFEHHLTMHYMRHTYSSQLYESNIKEFTRHKLLGHSLKGGDITNVYTHLTDEDILKEAQPYLDFIDKKIKSALSENDE